VNIQFMDPNGLIHYEHNSKTHPPEQVDAIAQSIAQFGFDQPVVVDAKGVIIKGHGRTLAAIKLGLKEIPVIVREVNENDARFLREVDNKIQSTDWDKENLATELLTLKDMGKLEFTLFTESQIPKLPELVINAKVEDFDLTTRHRCTKCEYEW
jgi:ParB-like chromosome segregation protein Spo0J